jgi:multidrug efflux pump subunit AcrB/ABC-type multidrug transport system ATPase subunit
LRVWIDCKVDVTAFFIKRPVLVCMLLVAGCLLGSVSYNRLAVELIPFAELPMLIVQVQSVRDADPHYIERQAVIPLESAIAGLEGIERIETRVEQRRAMLFVYYTRQSDQKYAFLKLEQRVAATRTQLGDEFLAMVFKLDTEQLSSQFMSVQARGSGGLDQIRHVVDEKVVGELENVEGMANVAVYGGRQQSVEVLLTEDLLRSYDLTLSEVSASISRASRQRRYLGQVEEAGQRLFVNLSSDFGSLAELEETIVRTEPPLRLGQIATVIDGGAQRETIARINGLEAITITLVSDRQANLLALSAATRQVLRQLNADVRTDGVELVIQSDSAEVIEDNIGDIKSLAVIGGLLAVGVLWVFLRNLPLVAIVAAAMPVSVLIAMNLFYAFDITLNTLSLVGIAVAIGMLLDNSIVVLESIYRQLARGQEAATAVVVGVSQVWRAVLAATLTTVCVFLPFVFSENFLVRLLGRQVGMAIISTLLVSLAVALLLIPVFVYQLSRSRRVAPTALTTVSQRQRLVQVYTLLLKSCMRFPVRTVVVAVVAFFVSILLSLVVSINTPVEVELTTFDLYASLPRGSTLQVADDLARGMDERLADIDEVAERRMDVQSETIRMTFELHDDFGDFARRDLAAVKGDVHERLRQTFQGVEFTWQQPRSDARYRQGGGRGGGGGSGARAFERLLGIGQSSERIAVRGPDLGLLQTIVEDLRFNLDRLPGVRYSSPGITPGQPQIDLLIDRPASSYFGVESSAIAGELSTFEPQVSSTAQLKRGTELIDVVLKNSGYEQRSVDDLRQLQVATVAGGRVPLLEVADLVFSQGFDGFSRVNQEKEVELSYALEKEITESKVLLDENRAAVDQLAAELSLPAGVSVEVIHDETDLSEFYFLIGASIVLIYMILTSVFESLLAPLAMMIALPLATIGALWGLIATGNSLFNANALVGFLILLGVVVNNGIMLIDYARQLQRQGCRLGRALLSAGQVRVRPILITALSTMLAMLPLAMGRGEYVARIGVPFAVAVIGGLVAGTLFTLVLVPTVYFGLSTMAAWVRDLGWRLQSIQVAALAWGVWLIHQNVDSTFWQFADGTALLGLVPALAWFTQSSLRRSRADLIPAGTPLQVSVANVVKVYDERSRFARQWDRGRRQSLHEQGEMAPKKERREDLVWQLPLLAFHAYFTYLYLRHDFWIVVLSVAWYAHLLSLVSLWLPTGAGWWRRLVRLLYQLLYWGLPALHLAWFQSLWDLWGLQVVLGVSWYLGAAVHRGSRKLYRGEVNVDAITGRFRRSRRAFYLVVAAIPIIGKRRRPFTALSGVSLEIGNGMFGLIGPNGAGKTTLMRVICGILDQSLGTVRVNGIDLSRRREELQALIGYLPQEFGTYENMTARQFLDYQALLKGKWDADERRQIVDEVLRSVHLEEAAGRKIGGFSGGMKQRVGIAQTLLHLPRILVVDEPTAGLDPRERIRFRNLLAELSRDRVVIFSTHIIEDISSSCNRLAVLGGGEVRFHGTPQDMVELTRGCVWQARIGAEQFEQLRTTARVVHHMRQGEQIRVRLLAAEMPLPEAESVTPTLEDSYLWLLEKGVGR